MKKYFKFFFIAILISIVIIEYHLIDKQIFNKPVCTVINDKDGNLLGAHITSDEQWRFPQIDSLPNKFIHCILNFEDKRFFYHNGVDIYSLLRAIYLNIKYQKIVSGGSTLTMQVIRMSRGNPSRTIFEKLYEIILSIRLEKTYNKKEILALYASNAPFGGNVVGLEAASWRYFGRKPSNLTWAESAMLAVLPNSPSLIHLGKNRYKLKQKRDRLLKTLFDNKIINRSTYDYSIIEEIPEKPVSFPQNATHLLNRINSEIIDKNKSIYKTTIELEKQLKTTEVVNNYYKIFSDNNINNIATLIVENKTNNVVAYVGNVLLKENAKNNYQVDVINSRRSTGSVLKPFLYCAMLSSGEIMPQSLVADIPIQIKGYNPKNYNRTFSGAVPASKAIARSLNIPAVKMLQQYGIDRFIHILSKLGIKSINKSSEYYGLSLILGGAEAKLWEIVGAYSSMARSLSYYSNNSSTYSSDNYRMPNFILGSSLKINSEKEKFSFFNASAIWYTFNTMIDVERPEEESNWEQFDSKQKIAWKTGTSFGFKDGWAVGVTPNYTVGVWVGNADGEGSPDLTGIKTAAPILFEIFDFLPAYENWFEQPYDDMIKEPVCSESGFLASPNCTNNDSVWIPYAALKFKPCPYHKIIQVDLSEKYRVNNNCESINNIKNISWFVLPPAMEYYYTLNNKFYKPLPPLREDCLNTIGGDIKTMEIIYPDNLSQILIPVELDGKKGKCVFEVAHTNQNATIFWHIDDKYYGSTITQHKLALNIESGIHTLTLIDENGYKLTSQFSIIDSQTKR